MESQFFVIFIGIRVSIVSGIYDEDVSASDIGAPSNTFAINESISLTFSFLIDSESFLKV